jgi:hypothetical protein
MLVLDSRAWEPAHVFVMIPLQAAAWGVTAAVHGQNTPAGSYNMSGV